MAKKDTEAVEEPTEETPVEKPKQTRKAKQQLMVKKSFAYEEDGVKIVIRKSSERQELRLDATTLKWAKDIKAVEE